MLRRAHSFLEFRRVRWLIVLFGLWSVWALGQVFRDRNGITELAFYFPSPVLLVLLLVLAFWAWRRRRRTAAVCALVLALGPAVFVLRVENHFRAGHLNEPAGPTFRLVHWNVCRGYLGWSGVGRELREEEADIYVVSEPRNRDVHALAKSFGKEYSSLQLGVFAVIARGPLRDGHWLECHKGLNVYCVLWKPLDRPCKVFIVDLDSTLFVPRDPRLRRLLRLVEEHQPDIVVGDFNAPRRSRALCSLPPGYAHAYDAAGSGWSYTWPVPIPVYAIDQCILGRRIDPVRYRLDTSVHSDHRRQVLDFSIAEANGER